MARFRRVNIALLARERIRGMKAPLCEANPNALHCDQRAVHTVVYDPPTNQRWLTPRYVRYVCRKHADIFCNHGWGIPRDTTSFTGEE